MAFPRVPFLAFGLCLLAAACRPVATAPDDVPASDPATAVNVFLAGYGGDFRAADPSALSSPLALAIESAMVIEQQSRVAVLASEYPSDKPQLLEGELFSGLYEGFTGYELGEDRVDGDTATVDVIFTNSHYGVGWVDRVGLIDENGWKIDDVLYLDKKTGALGLRDVLRNFEEAAAQDPLLHPPNP
jgi:hypothetical protein